MNLKELKATLKIMRDNGVTHLKTADIELTLVHDALFPRRSESSESNEAIEDSENPYAGFPNDILTPKQLMFYSSGGAPEDDPLLKDKQ